MPISLAMEPSIVDIVRSHDKWEQITLNLQVAFEAGMSFEPWVGSFEVHEVNVELLHEGADHIFVRPNWSKFPHKFYYMGAVLDSRNRPLLRYRHLHQKFLDVVVRPVEAGDVVLKVVVKPPKPYEQFVTVEFENPFNGCTVFNLAHAATERLTLGDTMPLLRKHLVT